MPLRKHDYIGAFNFKVEIEGVTQGAFKSVHGLDSETEIVDYLDGDDRTMRLRPARTTYSNIVLKRGYVNSDELWKWFEDFVINGNSVSENHRSGSIVMLDYKGQEAARYNFFEAWPCRWSLSALDGKSTDTIEEEYELVIERLERG
jgi:phage tail-like protein